MEVSVREAQNSLQAIGAEPASRESIDDRPSDLMMVADGDHRGEFGMDNGAAPSGHTWLSRPPAPQGRRSLFRR